MRAVGPLLLLLLLPATATARPAPTLPASFRADIVRHVTEAGDPHVTNLTAAYDAASLRYHIVDYTTGYAGRYEAWFTEGHIFTFSPENIPPPHHCTCLPASNLSYLAEFYSLDNATRTGKPGLKIDGQAVDAWTVHGEILSGDVYTAFVEAGSNVPVRTVWVDPGINTTERSDYKNVVIGRPPASEFIPNRACQQVKCG